MSVIAENDQPKAGEKPISHTSRAIKLGLAQNAEKKGIYTTVNMSLRSRLRDCSRSRFVVRRFTQSALNQGERKSVLCALVPDEVPRLSP